MTGLLIWIGVMVTLIFILVWAGYYQLDTLVKIKQQNLADQVPNYPPRG